jgi:hypothetical protein
MKDFQNWPVQTKYVDLYDIVSTASKTRMKSSFIYPIAKLEEIFGDLWGEYKDESIPLTPEEEAFEKKFLAWRKAVLDYGHSQCYLLDGVLHRYLKDKNGKDS